LDSGHSFPVTDVHVHIHPEVAADFLQVMDANNVDRVVNLGTLERLGIPIEEGLRVFRQAMGRRLVYFWTPGFGDAGPGFGERMAQGLERAVEVGACGLKIFKDLGLRRA
jgi:hypothetical protein